MRKISILTMILTAVLTVVGCNKTFEMDLPLAVSSRVIDLTKDAGTTHIMIFADGDWTAKFTETTEWASLDRLNGNGNSEVVLSFSANYGLSRRLAIALAKSELRDTIFVNQEGMLSEPSLVWPCDSVGLCKNAGKATLKMKTNLYYSLQNIETAVEYKGEAKDWLSDVTFDGRLMKFAFTENSSAERRRANISVKVAVPGNSSTEDKTETFNVTVSQSSDEPALEIAEVETLAGMKAQAVVETPVNSVWAYADNLKFTVDYTPEVAPEEGWITNLALTPTALTFDIDDNMSGDDRSAVIKVFFNGELIAEKTVNQDVYPVIVDFAKLRTYPLGEELTAREFIDGYVVSDNTSANVCLNPQTKQFKFDLNESKRTMMFESLDGKYGFAIKYKKLAQNTLPRYSKVRISLKGLTLSKNNDPEYYTITGMTEDHVASVEEPNPDAVPMKRKNVSELTDADIYTLVSLKDMEVVFKDGSYTNCTDGYSILSDFNTAGGKSPRWDVAPLLLTDKYGQTISMLTNSMVPWRRDGEGVAQGSGDFKGIIVAETLIRYGDRGRYQIRPMVKNDIALTDAPFSKTIVEWNWNDAKDDLIPEIGEGNISGVSVKLSSDYNALICANDPASQTKPAANNIGGKGVVNNQCGDLYSLTEWKVGASFDVDFSTKGISGSNLQIGFVWGKGKGGNTNIEVPSHWKLLYSVDDGDTFKEFVPMVKNRPIVWWNNTPVDVTPGYTDHMFQLPQECFGKEKVIVRFQVADNVCDIDPKSNSTNWATALSTEQGTFTTSKNPIRFGSLTVRYN